MSRAGHRDSFRLLAALTRALEERLGPLQRPDNACLCPLVEEFAAACAASGRRVQTVRDAWSAMLCSIRGLGVEGALAVVQAYPTPAALFAAYDKLSEDPSRDPATLLCDLRMGRRSISREASASVYAAFFAPEGGLTSVAQS